MRPRDAITQLPSPAALSWILALCAATLPAAASAQQQPPAPQSAPAASSAPAAVPTTTAPPQDTSIYTLHVYANLMEIPTLVLGPHLAPVPPIAPDGFAISLDGGPEFHPTQLQIEGNQPLSLAILLDLGGPAHSLEPSLVQSLPDFAARSLHPGDRLSLYSVVGSCISGVSNIRPSESGRIAASLQQVLHPNLQQDAARAPLHCGKSAKLWNAAAAVAKSLSTDPGLRVMLIVSGGQDHDSPIHWPALRQFCAGSSIAAFGLSPIPLRGPDPDVWIKLQEDPFSAFTQLTGGMVLYAFPAIVPRQLKHFIDLVRGRYILEFPAPGDSPPGVHSIEIKVGDTGDFVRPAGIAFVPTDPSLLSNPATVTGPPSPATFGDRKVLPPPTTDTPH